MRNLVLALSVLALSLPTILPAGAASWEEILERARGQTVYWNAWAGDPRINDYIDWAAEQVEQRYGVNVRHVKVTDTAQVVSRVLAEKAAGRQQGGTVDLIWINGENFAAMKENQLLFGPWVEQLPNWELVDVAGKPTVLTDFTVPTEGLESPWGMAQLVFVYDAARVSEPPRTIPALLGWARDNPGRFTYPQPPDFLGSTFLKQALIELTDDPQALQAPVENPKQFQRVTAPLWSYLEALHPQLWRSARAFPANGPAQRRLLADGEVDMALSFHPAETSAAIASRELPPSVRTFVLEGGTIGNTHFVAIPFNANAKAGAMVLANFLLSPQAQARKQDPAHWGDFTVLDLDALEPEDRARFQAIPLGVATLSPQQLGTPLAEPHPDWMEHIEAEWQRRYAAGD
ncbi:MAG: ABC transporter substrate-binding protein [Candidatus Competibacteraceae bacterium]|nr:ABC transporter substrate-binding protein [Candidatus Competibacteraceae bacterium]